MALSHKALVALTNSIGDKYLSNLIDSQEVLDALAIVAEQTIREELGDVDDSTVMDMTCMMFESVGYTYDRF